MFDKLLSIANTRNLYRSLFFLLFMIVVMNLGATAFYRYTHGVGILDTAGGANILDNRMGGYSPETAYKMIAAYGKQGIRYHLLLTAGDIVFPPSLALFFAIAITYFYSRLFSSRQVLRWLLVLPAIYLAADYLENVSIVTMLLSFPRPLSMVAVIGNTMFTIKNLSSAAAAMTTVIGLSAWLFHRARKLSATVSQS